MTEAGSERGWPLSGEYRVDLFSQQEAVRAEDVVAMWTGEGALPAEEARRRVGEILVVATDRQRQPVGVSTTQLRRHQQLRAELWHSRVFVASAHRQSHLAVALAMAGRDHLVERFREGTDRRGIGVIFNVESELLKRSLPQADWPRTHFLFIAENARGDHVRVYYFPGALAPEPDQ